MSNRREMLWLGVLMGPEEKQEAAEVLNEALGIQSVEITDDAVMAPDDTSIVRFTIDEADTSKVIVTRLHCDAKWAEDYPQYANLFNGG